MVNAKLCSFLIMTLIFWPYKLNAMLLMRMNIRAGKTVYFNRASSFTIMSVKSYIKFLKTST